MDLVDLERKLASLDEENQRRTGDASRDDLLRRSLALEAMARRTGRPEAVAAALRSRADVFLASNRNREAIEPLQVARDTLQLDRSADEVERDDRLVRVLARLAEAQARLERWQDVHATCASGIPLVERLRAGVTPLYLQSAYLRFGIGLYTWGARAAWELGDVRTMLAWTELSKSRAALRYAEADSSSDAFLAHFRELDARIARMAAIDHDVPPNLLRQRQDLWDRMYLHRFRARADDAPTPEFKVESVQALLEHDEAVLSYYWLDRERLLLIAIDRDQVLTRVQPVSNSLYGDLKQLSSDVLDYAHHHDSERVRPDLDISELLLPEELDPILENKRRLSIAGHRLLHSIPFAALDWRGGYLIQDFALTHVPNLTSLLIPRRPSRGSGLLALGIGEYALRDVPPLRQAEIEVAEIAAMHMRSGRPATLLRGAQANLAAVHRMVEDGAFSEYRYVHMATHGNNVNAEAPMEARLLLQDAPLDGVSISSWHLDADLVVLSACSSGQRPFTGRGLGVLPGDELFGLQAAFFAAGARQVIGALWPVSDEVAPALMRTLHRELLSNVPADVALQRAMVQFAEAAGRTRLPYFWAPLVLSAMGRTCRPF